MLRLVFSSLRSIAFAPLVGLGLCSTAHGQTSIQLVDLRSDRAITLASGGTYRKPTISQDGTLVAYQVADSNEHSIEVVGVTGKGRQRYRIKHEPLDHEMRWSPDGKWLAFRSDPQGVHSSKLQLLEARNGKERTLISTLVEQYVWRGDSRALRFVEHGESHTVKELTIGDSAVSLRILEASIPDIGGIQFYKFSAALVGSRSAGVFTVPLPDGKPRLLTKTPRRGRATALRDGRVAVPLNDSTAIEIVAPDGSSVTLGLSFTMATYVVGSLPNGHLVAAASAADKPAGVYSLTPAGTSHLRYGAPPGASIKWFEVSRDGRFLVVAVTETAVVSREH